MDSMALSMAAREGTGGLRYGDPGSYHFRGDPDWAGPDPTFLFPKLPDLCACLFRVVAGRLSIITVILYLLDSTVAWAPWHTADKRAVHVLIRAIVGKLACEYPVWKYACPTTEVVHCALAQCVVPTSRKITISIETSIICKQFA